MEEKSAHMVSRPVVVTLCGSTRFKDEFVRAAREETLAGKIVLSVGLFGHEEGLDMDGETKEMLDRLHFEKIKLSDEVLILNKGGYIGKSTRRELNFARALGKKIRFLEPVQYPPKDQILTLDIDGVIARIGDPPIPYYEREPYPEMVNLLARWRKGGCFIRLQTARGMDEFKGNLREIEEYHRPRLEDWLEKWQVPYDELAFGKVVSSIYIDDLGFRFDSEEGRWEELEFEIGVYP